MDAETKTQITHYLADFSSGNPKALDELIPLVYPYLKQVARGFLRKEYNAGTLQPTALVHEAFVRLLGQHSLEFQNRNHFYALVASFMRRVLVDKARKQQASKRKDDTDYKYLLKQDAAEGFGETTDDFLVNLEVALKKLEQADPRRAKLVELKFFANLSNEEIATAMDTSLATVKRDWLFAKAWLSKEMGQLES